MMNRTILNVLTSVFLIMSSSLGFAEDNGFDLTGFVDEETLKAITSVTRKYHSPVIRKKVLDALPYKSRFAYADQKPWSSYWYPKIDDSIFKESDSALRKYDRYRAWYYKSRNKSVPGSAADFEESNYDPDVPTW